MTSGAVRPHAVAQDYHLSSGSPCADKLVSTMSSMDDPDGEVRPRGAASDCDRRTSNVHSCTSGASPRTICYGRDAPPHRTGPYTMHEAPKSCDG